MSRFPLGAALPAAAATLFTAIAVAQPAATSAPRRADPADPAASVPALDYRSAFAGYRPNVEQPLGAWRELNDKVGRIGGWRVYAREAQSMAAPASGPGSAPAAARQR